MKKLFIIITAVFLFKAVPAQNIRDLRAVHMGGNWGSNVEGTVSHPAEYFDWLKSINANWVGISIALHIDDSMDSTVSRKYNGSGILTFTDEVLINTISALQQNGFHVYLTLAFETQEAEKALHPVSRWQLGDPKMPSEDSRILPAFWPWAIEHPDHADFVKKFWETYTEQAVHFAELAQDQGVSLFSLGTETERLFRSRPSNYWPNEYSTHLKAMVDSVRAVYHGSLTYDMGYDALTFNDFYGPGSNDLWEDLGLDVIGISAYFKLVETKPVEVMGVGQLEPIWDQIFSDYLIPLKNANPDLPILFLEFGYVNAIESPFQPNYNEFQPWSFTDSNGNFSDDSEEVQSNIYEAFFNVKNLNPGIIEGAFLWGHDMADDAHWASAWGHLHHFGIRQKLAENTVRTVYAEMASVKFTHDDILTDFSTAQNFPNPFNATTMIEYSIVNPGHVRIEVFDQKGRKVKTLVNGFQPAGIHCISWTGLDENHEIAGNGLYLYKVTVGNRVKTKKMLFLK